MLSNTVYCYHFILCSFKIEIRLVLINCLIWWGLALYNFLTLHNDDIFITGGHQNLAFYRTIPNEETVLEFVEKIISTSKKYLKEKYTKVELSMSEEAFFSQLRWLQEREVITDLELKELMNIGLVSLYSASQRAHKNFSPEFPFSLLIFYRKRK